VPVTQLAAEGKQMQLIRIKKGQWHLTPGEPKRAMVSNIGCIVVAQDRGGAHP
jgi:hypothetical protein